MTFDLHSTLFEKAFIGMDILAKCKYHPDLSIRTFSNIGLCTKQVGTISLKFIRNKRKNNLLQPMGARNYHRECSSVKSGCIQVKRESPALPTIAGICQFSHSMEFQEKISDCTLWFFTESIACQRDIFLKFETK